MRSIAPLIVALVFATSGASSRSRVVAQAPAPMPCATTPAAAADAGVERVPIELSNNHVYLSVCAGERLLHFLLDTGAGQSFFDLEIARSLGVELGSPFRARGAGAGTVAGAVVREREVRLAGTRVTIPMRSAIDFSGITAREGRHIEGVIGYDFIARFVVAIDYLRGEIRLHEREGFTYTGRGTTVPVTFANNHPHIEAALTLADGGEIRGRFVVDVGSSLALALTKPFVDQHGLRDRTGQTVRRPSGGGVGGPSVAEIGRVAALRIGTAVIRAPVTHLFGDEAGVFTQNPHWDGNIGGDILRRFIVIFDYQNKRMILEPHERTGEPFESDMSGANFVGVEGQPRLRVDFVLPGSPAAAAGLSAGDLVFAVDGKPVTAGSLLDLRTRLRRERETVELQIERGEERTTVRVVTRRLV